MLTVHMVAVSHGHPAAVLSHVTQCRTTLLKNTDVQEFSKMLNAKFRITSICFKHFHNMRMYSLLSLRASSTKKGISASPREVPLECRSIQSKVEESGG